jgi:hypothetical protein
LLDEVWDYPTDAAARFSSCACEEFCASGLKSDPERRLLSEPYPAMDTQ